MDSRLDKLLHQRDLLRDHLRWIEEEIAVASQTGNVAPTAVSAAISPIGRQSTPTPISPLSADSDTAREPANEPMVDECPEPDLKGLQSSVRSGCFLYFTIAFGALALLVVYIYWFY